MMSRSKKSVSGVLSVIIISLVLMGAIISVSAIDNRLIILNGKGKTLNLENTIKQNISKAIALSSAEKKIEKTIKTTSKKNIKPKKTIKTIKSNSIKSIITANAILDNTTACSLIIKINETKTGETISPKSWCNGADFNNDTLVDQADYTIWFSHYGTNVAIGTNGDANKDGRVDQADYTIWFGNYGTNDCIKIVSNESVKLNLVNISAIPIITRSSIFPLEMYQIEAYDSSGKYYAGGFESSRFIFYDNFDGTGGVRESDESENIVQIPYSPSLNQIKINYKGDEQTLGITNIPSCSTISCISQNNTGDYSQNIGCCGNLFKVPKNDTSFACVNCGDNICSDYEDYSSCSEDCSR